jgi:hypothetical protein
MNCIVTNALVSCALSSKKYLRPAFETKSDHKQEQDLYEKKMVIKTLSYFFSTSHLSQLLLATDILAIFFCMF